METNKILEILVKAEEAKLKALKEALANGKEKEKDIEVFTEKVKEVETIEEVMPKPDEKVKSTKKVKKDKKATGDKAFEDMTAKELIAVCEAHELKVLRAGRNKKYYLDKLAEAGVIAEETKEEAKPVEKAKKEAEPIEEESNDDWEIEEEVEEVKDPYANKSAKELFTECKERGLEVKPRQTAETYKNLLVEDDNKPEVADNESDDWDISDDDSDDDWEI